MPIYKFIYDFFIYKFWPYINFRGQDHKYEENFLKGQNETFPKWAERWKKGGKWILRSNETFPKEAERWKRGGKWKISTDFFWSKFIYEKSHI